MVKNFQVFEKSMYLFKKNLGFTYITLLITIAILAIVTTATTEVTSLQQQRVAEEELLSIGLEYRNALEKYVEATPVGQEKLPTSLDQLLKDPRYPTTQRYLRKIYYDPITKSKEWGLVLSEEDNKSIIGVFSLSTKQPIKIDNFNAPFQGFTGKSLYRDWIFGLTI